MRVTLNFMFPGIGHSNRDSSRSSSTGGKRPDYLFILNSICVFRGEEKRPGVEMQTPRLELTEKTIWSYGAVLYLFGYSAVGTNVSLYAIVHDDNLVDSIHLASFQLSSPNERLRLFLAILNLSWLLQSIADLCPASGRNEDQTFDRGNGVIVHLKPSYVVKIFVQRSVFDVVARHLKQVYDILREHQVPNVDNLFETKPIQIRLKFEPRGIEIKPSSLSELFCALRCVLEALVKLHQALWMHRDIRWSNVMKRRDDAVTWFLIDFVDSASSPQPTLRGRVLSKNEHAPEIFVDSVEHTTAIDIWSVGYLIETSGVFSSWNDWGPRAQFFEHLVDYDPLQRPNAEEALKTLNALEVEYTNNRNAIQACKRRGRSTKERRNKHKAIAILSVDQDGKRVLDMRMVFETLLPRFDRSMGLVLNASMLG